MSPGSLDSQSVAADIYARTCRTDFSEPGFCALNVGHSFDSAAFRQLMVDIKRSMTAIHEAQTPNTLIYLSVGRFDQQETTKPHLDGGPDECFLMIGYEPTDVNAEIEISDYAKCAHDLGMSPKDFMAKHNPMFQDGRELLRPYSTRIPCLSSTDYLIVCINNSSGPFSVEQPAWQGTLHTANILTPDDSKRRVINSTLIASAPMGTPETVTESQQDDFVKTSMVRRRGHDRPYVDDDM